MKKPYRKALHVLDAEHLRKTFVADLRARAVGCLSEAITARPDVIELWNAKAAVLNATADFWDDMEVASGPQS